MGVLVTPDGSITLPGLLLAIGVPLLGIGHYKVPNDAIGSFSLLGKPIELIVGAFCVTSGLALTVVAVIVEGRDGNGAELKYEFWTPEEILGDLRSLATENATSKKRGGPKGDETADRQEQNDTVAKCVLCLDSLAIKFGKDQAKRKKIEIASKKEMPNENDGVWGGLVMHRPHELELLCQEAAYIVLRLHSCNDAAVSSALSLLALVAGDKEVRRRNYEEADRFGLDVPVLVLRDALTRAKESEEPHDDEERISAELQRKGCLLLGAISNEDQDIATKVVDEDGLVAILDAVDWYRYHEEVANWALWAIFVLCYDHLGNKGELIKLGGIQKICRVMKDIPKSLEVARHGIAILFDMMREVPGSLQDVSKIRMIALNAGMHEVVKKSMDEFPESTEVMMMGQQMLVATGYKGEVPLLRQNR